MNNAEIYHIGNYPYPETATTTAIAPTIGRVRPLDATPKRCKRSTERQTAIRTDNHVANGFLNCTFLPKLKATKTVQACKTNTERDFYTSLSQLAEHYQITPLQTESFGFPYNIVLSMWDLETQLSRTHINWDSLNLVQDSQKTYLESKEKFDTGTNLYYIPIVPLFLMLKDPKRKKTAQLLISVCSYLYHIADVPYYRQEDSYLYWLYDMMLDWVEQDDEQEEMEQYKRDIRQAEWIGNRMEQKLFNRINLKVFKQRLKQFRLLVIRLMPNVGKLPVMRSPFTRNIRQRVCSKTYLFPNRMMITKLLVWKNTFRSLPTPKVGCTRILKITSTTSSTNTEQCKNRP